MNASELQQVWNRQRSLPPPSEDIARIAATVGKIDRTFRRKIWWRDLREVGTALILSGLCALFGQTWLRWISVACGLFVAAVLIRSHLFRRPAAETESVTGRLRQMIRETETQIKLLRSVVWWYLLPCAVATLALVLDRSHRPLQLSKFNTSNLLVFFSGMAVLYLVVYWLNQRAVRTVLEPRHANLQKALAELTRDTP